MLHSNLNRSRGRLGTLEWNVHLITVNDLKRELREPGQLLEDDRERVLSASWPRFIWRAQATVQDWKIFDVLFDATDIMQSRFLLTILWYGNEIAQSICALAELNTAEDSDISNLGRSVLAALVNGPPHGESV